MVVDPLAQLGLEAKVRAELQLADSGARVGLAGRGGAI
jgi:hypothetical protein